MISVALLTPPLELLPAEVNASPTTTGVEVVKLVFRTVVLGRVGGNMGERVLPEVTVHETARFLFGGGGRGSCCSL